MAEQEMTLTTANGDEIDAVLAKVVQSYRTTMPRFGLSAVRTKGSRHLEIIAEDASESERGYQTIITSAVLNQLPGATLEHKIDSAINRFNASVKGCFN